MSVKYEIDKHVGLISHDEEYSKQVNLISWNDRKSVIDVRSWRGERPLKGITLTKDEAVSLIDLLKKAIA